jgi:hypothetical protein
VLGAGTGFRWTTFGLTIESKVHEYVVNQRLGWYGYVPGAKPSFYHSWYLKPEVEVARVVVRSAKSLNWRELLASAAVGRPG